MMLAQIAGHLGADPEQRVTPSGQKVWSLRVAVNTKKGGVEKTIWWRVTVWGDRFDKLFEFLKKGSGVIINGRFGVPEVYTDRNGNTQVSLDITAEMINLSPFGRSQSSQQSAETAQGESNSTAPQGMQGITSGAGQANFADDDIPF